MIRHLPKNHNVKQVNDYAYKRYYQAVKREASLFWLNIHYLMGLNDKEREELGKYGNVA